MTVPRIVSHIVLLLLLPAALLSQSVEETFDRAGTLFRDGKFSEAAAAYESILAQGKTSAQIYYNLGNAYYRAGELGRAILNYERAKVLSPGDADVEHNLDLANLRTLDRLERVPEIFLINWLRTLAGILPFTVLVAVFVLSWVVLFVALAVMNVVPTGRLSTWMRWTVLGAIAFLVIFGALVLVQVLDQSGHDDAVILAQVVTAKTSPDQQSSDAFVIHEGLKVKLGDEVGGWVKITLSDGKVGWIQPGQCERI
jgi:tetratricopeptide (TPR) repeat protein